MKLVFEKEPFFQPIEHIPRHSIFLWVSFIQNKDRNVIGLPYRHSLYVVLFNVMNLKGIAKLFLVSKQMHVLGNGRQWVLMQWCVLPKYKTNEMSIVTCPTQNVKITGCNA